MPNPALKLRWHRPELGVKLVDLGSAPSRGNGLVLAPVGHHTARWSAFEPSDDDVNVMARDATRLRVERPGALTEFENRWGPIGVAHAAVELGRRGGALTQVEPLESAVLAIAEFQTAIALHAGAAEALVRFDGERDTWRLQLPEPDGAQFPQVPTHPEPQIFWRRKKTSAIESLDAIQAPSMEVARERWLHQLIARRLRTWEEHEDAPPFGWRVTSPLGAAWRVLAEAVSEGLKAQICETCHRPFVPMLTNKRRLTSPPRYCADGCRVTAARRRKRDLESAPKRPRRKRQ